MRIINKLTWLGRRVIKFEFEDEDGGRYVFRLEGKITREKIMKLLDIYELMNLKVLKNNEEETSQPQSLQERILKIIEEKFTFKEFSSRELQEAYEDKYNQPIKLSIISTYLRRFYDNGILDRARDNRRGWRYMLRGVKIEKTSRMRT